MTTTPALKMTYAETVMAVGDNFQAFLGLRNLAICLKLAPETMDPQPDDSILPEGFKERPDGSWRSKTPAELWAEIKAALEDGVE